jgi:hypothetical protein
MSKRTSPSRVVREPVQAYLDEHDRDLLEKLVVQTGLTRAELIRRGLRRLAGEDSTEGREPGWSLGVLTGSLLDAPSDLATRHDNYLTEEKRGEE